MRIAGAFRFDARRDDVFRAICDPLTLMAVIPGCETIEQVGPQEYRGRITLRLPGFAGSYRTSIRLVDAVSPDRAGLEGRVDGALGSISGRGDFSLADDPDATVLEYAGQAVIQGPLAGLDSRFVERFAESLVNQGLQALDHRLAAERSAAAASDERQPPTEAPE